MANVNMPNGFSPYNSIKGDRGRVTRYWKDATAGQLTVGDAVLRVASSSDPEGGPEVVRAVVGACHTGIVVGVDPVRSDLSRHGYLAAAESGYIYVNDDPDQVFVVQEAGSGTALAVTDVGKHIDTITAAAGDTTIGRSVDCIDNNAKATDNTWIIVGLAPGSEVGAYAKWLVKANLHTEANAGATNIKEI